jgi:DNA-binding MarR family transcriptional regulator
MRIETFLQQSPMFAISRAARSFDALAARALRQDGLNFLEGLVLAALFFDEPAPGKPSRMAETFATTRGNISHCISTLEAKGHLQRMIDPADARSYLLVLKPQGKRCALRVIRAFDRLQAAFEKEAGKAALADALKIVRKLEALAQPR